MELIKRGNYNYLGHSFRKDGKATYREKYLGKEVPENIEEIKEGFLRKCLEEAVFKKLKRIKESFRKEWNSYPNSVKREAVIDLAIKFTYNTNAIEGSKITEGETDELIKRGMAPNRPVEDVQESLNHAKTFLQAINEKKELCPSTLLKWHYDIFKDTKKDIAGKLREYHIRVGSYTAPDWQDVERLMKEYLAWYNRNKTALNPVELAARMHYRFEKIHPFGDGNGRAGRLIIAYILMKAGYPIAVIEYKKRKSYYHALERDENYFLQYFIRRYLAAFKKYLR